MSLGLVVKAPEGLVLAADSRVTFATKPSKSQDSIYVHYDNATKLLSFKGHEYVGAVTYGIGAIGNRTAHSYAPEFEARLPSERMSVLDFAKCLSKFFEKQWNDNMPRDATGPMTFVVGGFNEKEPYGRVYLIDIPKSTKPEEKSAEEFGITIGGQTQVVERLLRGYDPKIPEFLADALGLDDDKKNVVKKEVLDELEIQIPYNVLPLQDSVDAAIFLIRATISAQKLMATNRGCGGPIDVAVITRKTGLKYIQRKSITGEQQRDFCESMHDYPNVDI